MAVLDDIKTILDVEDTDTSKDNLLNLYIRKAVTLITNYLNISTVVYTDSIGTVIQPIDVSITYPDAIIEYVTLCLNKKGNEGLKQFTQGSRSGTYENSQLPDSVILLLPVPYATLIKTTPEPVGVILP
jgi:hypothetical protein